MKKSSTKVGFVITVAVTLVIFYLIAKYVGFEKTIKNLERAELSYVILAIVSQFGLNIGIRALRWMLIMRKSVEISYVDSFLALIVGVLVNNLTPGAKVGGEPVRAIVIKRRRGITIPEGFGTVIADRLLDFAIIAILAIIGYIGILTVEEIKSSLSRENHILITFLLFVTIGFYSIIAYIVLNKKVAEKVIKKFPERYISRAIDALESFTNSIRTSLKDKKLVFFLLILSIFIWFSDILRQYFLFKSIGVDVGIFPIMIVVCITIMISAIPVTPGGIGVVEAFEALLYSTFGITKEAIGTMIILDMFIVRWLMIAVGASAIPLIEVGKSEKTKQNGKD